MPVRRLFALALAVLVAAPMAAEAQKKQRDVITREEILKSSQADGDLYTAIKVLRPHMVEMPRGQRSLGGSFTRPIAVYVDKVRQTGMDAVEAMRADAVAEVRYLDPSRSQNEYGITANGGAIVIKTYVMPNVLDSLAKAKPPR